MSEQDSTLQVAVKEIVAALLAGDWIRFASQETGRFYYVVREKDHRELEKFTDDWDHVEFAAPRIQSDFDDWYVRAVLAEKTADHFEVMRKKLRTAGFKPELVDQLIDATQAAKSAEALRQAVRDWYPKLTEGPDYIDHLLAFVSAMRIQGTKDGHFFIGDADLQSMRGAFELRLLRELAERFNKAVDRATEFEDFLVFFSPHLREAVRCYLYGFFNAAVLVSVAALDVKMRAVANIQTADSGSIPYKQLVAMVFGVAGVSGHDPAVSAALGELFDYRNTIAHEGAEANRERAFEALSLVRTTLERINL